MRLADKTSLLGPAAISWVWVLPGEPGPGAWITLLLESSLVASTGRGRSWGRLTDYVITAQFGPLGRLNYTSAQESRWQLVVVGEVFLFG